MTLVYFGINRAGKSVSGTLDNGTGAAFVERCYRNRWQGLGLKLNGRLVGAIITTDPGAELSSGRLVKARRSWWVETQV